MALKSTVFKVSLNVSDIGRGYYEEHALTLARHPSETDLRLLIRVVVFALNAHEHLQFTKGLSDVDEPDLWQIDLTGEIQHWIELGTPTEKRLRQSCSKANRVSVYTYQRGGAGPWLKSVANVCERFKDQLTVTQLVVADEAAVPALIDRTMALTCVIEDGQISLSNDTETLTVAYSGAT